MQQDIRRKSHLFLHEDKEYRTKGTKDTKSKKTGYVQYNMINLCKKTVPVLCSNIRCTWYIVGIIWFDISICKEVNGRPTLIFFTCIKWRSLFRYFVIFQRKLYNYFIVDKRFINTYNNNFNNSYRLYYKYSFVICFIIFHR